ncbi:MAG: hypothetical protein MUE69_25100 [Myxococcota bacterium]|jgi:hypothetical protein|nr:hypothetical protein [Myxococcota bacterium]
MDDSLRPQSGARVLLRRRDQDASRVVYALTLHLPEGAIEGEATLHRESGRGELSIDGAPDWLATFVLALLRQLWTSRRDPTATYPHRVLRWREAKD